MKVFASRSMGQSLGKSLLGKSLGKLLTTSTLRPLANSRAAELVDVIAGPTLLNLANESITGGKMVWVKLAPYGRHQHSAGMQVFEKSDAVKIIQDFANSRKSKLFGLPWYVGHPDHPAFQDKYKDTTSYARIKQLRAGEEALEGYVKFNSRGVSLVNEEAFDGHSPNWSCARDKQGYFRPCKLKSVGWTNDANLAGITPVQFANEAVRRNQSENTMNDTIRETLLARGLIEPGASEEDVTKACVDLANEVPGLRDKAGLYDKEVTAHSETKTTLSSTEENLANERKSHAARVVAGAIVAGKVETGKRDATIEHLLANEKDFESEVAKLEHLDPKFKVAPTTGSCASRNGAEAGHEQSLRELANEYIAEKGLTGPNAWDIAWSAVTKKHPELLKKDA